MVFVTRFGRCFTGISLRHRVVCNIGLCLKNFIVPVYPRYRVRLHLPNRIEIIIAVSVDKDRIACCVFNLIAVRRGCPAEEFVACGSGEADIVRRSYGCGRILRVTAVYKGLRAVPEIIMIRNRLGSGLIGVDCPQRDVLCDGNLIARVDELVVFRFPSAEVFGIFRRKYEGGAAAYILLVIRCYVFVLVLNVCDREAILCGGEERGNRNGAVKIGIYIEQRAVGINPSGGLFRELFKQCLKLFGIRKLCAVRNFNRFRSSIRRSRQVNRSFNNRRLPLCVERNALCRHRLVGEIIRRAFAKLILIPTSKRKVCGYTGRFVSRCVVGIGNILLILAAFGFFCLAAVNERNVIRVTGVVELCLIIIITNTRTYLFIKSKACNCILVFFCNAQPSIIIRSIFVIQFITCTVNIFRTSFTRNHFYIIVTCLRPCIMRRFVLIECCSTERHNINACLHFRRITILRNVPSALRLFRPLCGNIRAPFSGNGLIC